MRASITADDVDELWAKLSSRLAPDAVILLKGSRGMRLERLVPPITEWASSSARCDSLDPSLVRMTSPASSPPLVVLYHFLYPLAKQFRVLNVLTYISFRAVGAAVTALLLSFIFGPIILRALRRRR